MPLRVWAEFLPLEEASAPSTLQLLRRFDVTLCLSTPPEAIGPALARLLCAYADAGLEVALWLLLPKVLGYWPSERNAAAFGAHLERVFDWAARERAPIPWVAVDLEMPLPQALSLKNSRGLRQIAALAKIGLSNLHPRRFEHAIEDYQAILAKIHAYGAKTLCAAHDFIVEDFHLGAPIVQDFFETPVVDVRWDVVSAMIYNTMVADLFGATIDDARWLQYEVGLELKQAFGARAGVSLGLTGVGVLGDEPFYKSPRELAPDIAAARAAGLEDIAIFNLEGILHSKDPRAWFQIVADTGPAIPPRTSWAARERQRRRLLAGLAGRWRKLARLRRHP